MCYSDSSISHWPKPLYLLRLLSQWRVPFGFVFDNGIFVGFALFLGLVFRSDVCQLVALRYMS